MNVGSGLIAEETLRDPDIAASLPSRNGRANDWPR